MYDEKGLFENGNEKKSSEWYALACMTNDEELVFIRVFSAFKKLQTALQKEIQSLTDALAGEGISPDAIKSQTIRNQPKYHGTAVTATSSTIFRMYVWNDTESVYNVSKQDCLSET